MGVRACVRVYPLLVCAVRACVRVCVYVCMELTVPLLTLTSLYWLQTLSHIPFASFSCPRHLAQHARFEHCHRSWHSATTGCVWAQNVNIRISTEI